MKELNKQVFHMMYFGRWHYYEILSLPVGLRNWHYKLLTKQKEAEAEAMDPKKNSRRTLK